MYSDQQPVKSQVVCTNKESAKMRLNYHHTINISVKSELVQVLVAYESFEIKFYLLSVLTLYFDILA